MWGTYLQYVKVLLGIKLTGFGMTENGKKFNVAKYDVTCKYTFKSRSTTHDSHLRFTSKIFIIIFLGHEMYDFNQYLLLTLVGTLETL